MPAPIYVEFSARKASEGKSIPDSEFPVLAVINPTDDPGFDAVKIADNLVSVTLGEKFPQGFTFDDPRKVDADRVKQLKGSSSSRQFKQGTIYLYNKG
jgi:hypothetical protein